MHSFAALVNDMAIGVLRKADLTLLVLHARQCFGGVFNCSKRRTNGKKKTNSEADWSQGLKSIFNEKATSCRCACGRGGGTLITDAGAGEVLFESCVDCHQGNALEDFSVLCGVFLCGDFPGCRP